MLIGMDYIFGSFAEWMGVLEARPGSTHCSLSPAEWKTALSAAGYTDTLLITSSGSSISHMAYISQGALAPEPQQSSPSSRTPALTSSVGSSSPSSELVTPFNEESAVPVVAIDGPVEFMDALAQKRTMDGKLFSLPAKTEADDASSFINGALAEDFTVVRRFDAGGEVELVHFLSGLDSTKPYVFWFYTETEDVNTTLIGIVRSIRHEFSLWKLNMVLFHPSWSHSQQEAFVYGRLMSLKWVDAEVMVDEKGEMRVPRVVTSLEPPTVELRGDQPVEFDSTRVWRAFPADISEDDVEVTVSFFNLSPSFPGFAEFSGIVSAAGASVVGEGLVGKRYVFDGTVIISRDTDLSFL